MIFSALFIVSAAVLALQILQTRIFSFTLWHHLAYMVITVALMGMSASGTYLAMRTKKPKKKRIQLEQKKRYWNLEPMKSILDMGI